MNAPRPPEQGSGPAVLDPARFRAVLFDLDGVVTDTARIHAKAWAEMFDDFLERWSREHGTSFAPLTRQDYLAYFDGRLRTEAIRAFAAARGVALTEGAQSDGPEHDTVRGLAARKNQIFRVYLRNQGIDVYPSTVGLIQCLRELGIKTALVTASRNCAEILRVTGLGPLFDITIDGNDQAVLNLHGKPAPDMFLEAASRLNISPEQAVVVEDATSGVAGARAGGFGFVIGVDRVGQAAALEAHGADVVVADLSEVAVRLKGLISAKTASIGTELGTYWFAPSCQARRQRRHFHAALEYDPWIFAYDAFVPAVEGRRETLLALGNGYFVTRGVAAESRADDVHYPGTYLAGGYNRLTTLIAGQLIEHEDLVNLPNWLPLTFRINGGEWLDLRKLDILTYRQTLDLRQGLYQRRVRVRDSADRKTEIVERRFVNMRHKHLACQHVTIAAENWSGQITLRVGLDGRVLNAGVPRYRAFDNVHLRALNATALDPEILLLETETTQSQLRIAQAARVRIAVNGQSAAVDLRVASESVSIYQEGVIDLSVGDHVAIEKVVGLYTSRDNAIADGRTEARSAVERADRFDDLLNVHRLAWAHLWQRCDMELVEVNSDSLHDIHRVVRLHIFHLLQTVSPHSVEHDAGIPARGWHGEGYRGHIFWDELFIFPFLNLRMPMLSRALLLYRYRRLSEARWAARAAGYRGAMYPWQSGSNGREETDAQFLNPLSGNWIRDHTCLQRHVGAAVAYNVWHYYQATGDIEFLYEYGAEILFEIARFWASAARWNEARERYDIRGVIGPDEFHDRYPDRDIPGLDNNTYTNVMAAWCLSHALDLFELLPKERSKELCEELQLDPPELAHWDDVSRKLYIPFHGDGIPSQFEGYERLQEFDWITYNRKYDNIMRLDLILEAEGDSPARYRLSKQADLLMLLYLFSAEELVELFARLGYVFDSAQIPIIIDYYLRRTSHGSTLSAIVHAWVLARSRRRRSWPLFTDALHSDIGDIQGGTTPEGIHLGAMAGTIDLLQRCYTGLELRNNELHFNPVLPDELNRLSFRIRYRKHLLTLDLTSTTFTVASDPDDGNAIPIVVEDKKFTLLPGTQRSVSLQRARETLC